MGLYHADGSPVDRDLLASLTLSLAFRGPDGQDTWVDGSVGFGHAMLRTNDDSSPERQPCTLDGDVWITADARVDGREGLISRLREGRRNRAWVASETTDPELILHAYNRWGESCPEYLLGDFAFAIWDRPLRRLICARDPFGVKLLYYARFDRTIVFSNTLECVRRHPKVSDALNDVAIGDFLLVGYNQDLATTTFEDIQRVPPGHILTWEHGWDGPRLHRYWNLPAPAEVRYRDPQEHVEQFLGRFRLAVGDRLRTDRVGVYMSGGLDSTSIAAVAQEIGTGRQAFHLRAFTAVFERLIPDEEGQYASLAAEHIRIPLEIIPLDDHVFLEQVATPSLRPSEPIDAPDLTVWLDLAQRVANHGRVALHGEDPKAMLQPVPFTSMLKTAPGYRLVEDIIRYTLVHRRLPYLGTGLVARFKGLVPKRGVSLDTGKKLPGWLDPRFADRIDAMNRLRYNETRPHADHPTRPEVMRALESALWQSFIEMLDPGVTGLPLEIRLPYLDLRVVELLLSFPRIPWSQDKELLRRSFRNHLPQRIMQRPKSAPAGMIEARIREHREAPFVPYPLDLEGLSRYADLGRVPSLGGNPAPVGWEDFRPLMLGTWLAGIHTEEKGRRHE